MDQRGKTPSLSDLLAPSVYIEGGKVRRSPPSRKYIAALKAEGRRAPEHKGPLPPLSDASSLAPTTQLFYVKMAARDGDWRGLRGARPTPKMQDLFVIARAKYLSWRKSRDEEEERDAQLPKQWFELELGRWVLASSEERARALVEGLKPTASPGTHERIYPEIDTSRGCSAHGCRDCAWCAPKNGGAR